MLDYVEWLGLWSDRLIASLAIVGKDKIHVQLDPFVRSKDRFLDWLRLESSSFIARHRFSNAVLKFYWLLEIFKLVRFNTILLHADGLRSRHLIATLFFLWMLSTHVERFRSRCLIETCLRLVAAAELIYERLWRLRTSDQLVEVLNRLIYQLNCLSIINSLIARRSSLTLSSTLLFRSLQEFVALFPKGTENCIDLVLFLFARVLLEVNHVLVLTHLLN